MKYFKIEIKRAVNGKNFIIVILLGTAIVLMYSLFVLNLWNNHIDYYQQRQLMSDTNSDMNPAYEIFSLFGKWFAMDFGSWTSTLFFLILPLLASIAYGGSCHKDIKSGYIKNVIIRCDRKNYFLSKYAATFCAGALTAAIPLLVGIISVSTFLPALKPDTFYNSYYGVFGHNFMGGLFYSAPFVHMICKVLLISLFAGIMATTSVMLTFFVNNRFVVILAPFLFVVVFHYLSVNFFNFSSIEFSPLNYLHFTMLYVNGWIIFAEFAVLFAVSFFTTMYKGNKRDVF